MTERRRWAVTVAVGVGLAVGALAACTPTGPEDLPSELFPSTQDVADVALTAPDAGPSPVAELTVVPEQGVVTPLDGPFTDRVVVHDATLVDDLVTARIDVVKDVSELLALEVDVAWYDAGGLLVGSTRHVVDPEVAEEFHSTAGILGLPLEVPAPGGVSATLGFPVLVNE